MWKVALPAVGTEGYVGGFWDCVCDRVELKFVLNLALTDLVTEGYVGGFWDCVCDRVELKKSRVL